MYFAQLVSGFSILLFGGSYDKCCDCGFQYEKHYYRWKQAKINDFLLGKLNYIFKGTFKMPTLFAVSCCRFSELLILQDCPLRLSWPEVLFPTSSRCYVQVLYFSLDFDFLSFFLLFFA